MQNVLTTDLLETFLLLPHIYLLMSLQLFLIVFVISTVLGVAIFGSRLSKKYHKDIEMQGVSPTEVARCAKRNVVGHPASLCVRECVRACVRKEGRGGKKKKESCLQPPTKTPTGFSFAFYCSVFICCSLYFVISFFRSSFYQRHYQIRPTRLKQQSLKL